MDIKRWSVVFRALANINRLKIIKLLRENHKLSVGDIADHLKISLKATSNHLAIFRNLDVLEAQGISGHVFYSFNRKAPKDFQAAINLYIR